jgi:REP element-mobilizing transposase RayT
VLEGAIEKRCAQVFREVAKKYRAEIMAMEIMPDPVHLLVEVDPQFHTSLGQIHPRKNGERPGFPHFKGRHRFRTLVFTPTAFKVEGDHLQISKVGRLKIQLHRALPETTNTLGLAFNQP